VTARQRVRTGVVLLGAILITGTLWYWIVEGFRFVDALFQSTTTITTVGFTQGRPFDTSAKLFSIFLMVFGVGAALFTLGGVFEEFVEDQFSRFGRRRMDRQIGRLKGHVIVCGYGRVGKRIAQRLVAEGEHHVVVVDRDPERCDRASERGLAIVLGDSTEDDVLRDAGIERATVLIVSLASDADAISTVLSARGLNPALRIVARANEQSSEAKLARAGTDRIVNPLSSGAERMVAFARQPAVADFLDVVVHDGSFEYRLEELPIPTTSGLVGVTLRDAHLRSRTGALVLALRDPGGTFRNNPAPDSRLDAGTTLIAIGTDAELAALEALARSGARVEPPLEPPMER
jgi:voltage-gated potassium channel